MSIRDQALAEKARRAHVAAAIAERAKRTAQGSTQVGAAVSRDDALFNDPMSLIPGAGDALPNRQATETTVGEDIIGTGEAALTMATGATGGAVGFIGGTLTGLVDELRSGNFGTAEAADRIEKAAMEASQSLTYAPRTEAGQQQVAAIGEVAEIAAPLAGLAPQLQTIGAAAKLATPAARAAASPVTAPVSKAIGTGVEVAGTGAKAVGSAVQAGGKKAISLFADQSASKQKIAELLSNPDTAARKSTAGWQLKDAPTSRLGKRLAAGKAKVQKDPLEGMALKNNVTDDMVSIVRGVSDADNADMLKMLKIRERGIDDPRFRTQNRASDVPGNTLLRNVQAIRKANKEAGRDINEAAQTLKGKSVDITGATSAFSKSLDDIGVELVPNKGGILVPKFDMASVPPGDRGPLKEIIRQMQVQSKGGMDALAVHKMKRIIDSNVTFGKTKTGLSRETATMLKDFRRGLDSALDDKFPAYNSANTRYSKTIEALNAIQDVVGQKLDLAGGSADKALGTLLRRTMGQGPARTKMLDIIDLVDEAARSHGGSQVKRLPGKGLGKNDLLSQILFADELDKMYGTTASTSLQGQVKQGVGGLATDAALGAIEPMSGAISAGSRAVRGATKIFKKGDKGHVKSIAALRALLMRGRKAATGAP